MRDLDKMREKTAVILDSRHLFFLFFGGSVAAVLIFSLGVIVGRKMPVDDTAAEEDPLALLDQLGTEEEDLSFQRGLRGRSPDVARPKTRPKEEVKGTPREEPKQRPSATPDPEPAPVAAPARAPNKPAAEPPPPEPAPGSVPPGRFTLQLSSFQEKGEADEFTRMLKQRGYETYVVAADVPGRGLWYRVRLGSYDSHQAALEAKADFERKQRIIAYVLRN